MTAPIIPKAQREVAASPVSRFVTPAKSGLADLAESLSSFSPLLGAEAIRLQKQRDVQQFQLGKDEVLKLSQDAKAFRKAVASGAIEQYENPFYRLGAVEMSGRILADQFNAKALEELTVGKLRGATDTSGFDPLMAELRAEFLGKAPSNEMRRAFESRAMAYENNLRLSFTSQAGNRLVEQVRDDTYTEMRNAISVEYFGGVDPTEAVDVLLRRAIAMGMPGKEANNIVTAAVIDEALDKEDLELLKVLDRLPAGPGATVAGRRESAAAISRAEELIMDRQRRRADQAWTAKQREQAELSRTTMEDLVNGFLAGGGPELVRFAQEADPYNADSYGRMYDALANPPRTSEYEYVSSLMARANAGYTDETVPGWLGFDELNNGLMSGRLTQDDYLRVRSMMLQRDQQIAGSNLTPNDAFKDSTFLASERQLKSLFGELNMFGEFVGGVSRGNAALAADAQMELRVNWSAFWTETIRETGKPPTINETADFLTNQQNRLFRKYQGESRLTLSSNATTGGDAEKDPALKTDQNLRIITDLGNAQGRLLDSETLSGLFTDGRYVRYVRSRPQFNYVASNYLAPLAIAAESGDIDEWRRTYFTLRNEPGWNTFLTFLSETGLQANQLSENPELFFEFAQALIQ